MDDPSTGVGFLTARERQVIALIATGRTSKLIALEMDLSPRIVDRHVDECLQKLGAKNRAELIAKAFLRGDPAA
jgi:DNA-binding NarL/FixJ family response regulator